MTVHELRLYLAAKVSPEPNTGCWFLLLSTVDGYCQIRIGGVRRRAHRVFYEAFRGPIPKGLEPDHLCRTRCCVNPWHLELVTHQVNCQRGLLGATTAARQRAKTECSRGHAYTEENTYTNAGKRRCRTCEKQRMKAYYENRKRL